MTNQIFNLRSGRNNRDTNFALTIILLLLLLPFNISELHAQATLEFAAGDGNPTIDGPVQEAEARFRFNEENPLNNNFDTYFPETNATLSVTNLEEFIGVSQNSNGDSDNGNNPSTVIGYKFTNPYGPDEIFPNFKILSDAENSFFSSSASSIGQGIDIEENRAFLITTAFELLQGKPMNGRYHVANVKIEFNTPITDPVLHFVGLGAEFNMGPTRYGATAELELLDEGISLIKLSGNNDFVIDNYKILNGSSHPRESGEGAAHGSVLAEGNDIESLEFELFIRGEETNGVTFDGNNFAEDGWLFSISSDVKPDEIMLTGNSCWRMLSSPVQNKSYADLMSTIWTQGVDGANVESGTPNVFLWPDIAGNNNSDWTPPGNLNTNIEAGSGFMVSVFELHDGPDANYDEEFEPFPRKLTVTGSENPPLIFTGTNSNEGGWTLTGNPFKTPISIDELFNEPNTNGLMEVVYVWDRNTETGEGGNPPQSEFGSWRTYSALSNIGDIEHGAISQFQGFFVQNIDENFSSSQISYSDDIKTDEAQFYGKQAGLNSVRLSLQGESLYSSMWVNFSHYGNSERLNGDALKLHPLSEEYALISTRKHDELFDIAHFPDKPDKINIPVNVETTRSGSYTITATDFSVPSNLNLYFIDAENNKSIKLDESFSYQFNLNHAQKTDTNNLINCGMAPQKARNLSSDRFRITTEPLSNDDLPEKVTLNQNYPNPFNPTTQITYQLPEQSEVQLHVYDMLGRQIETLVNETLQAGTHSVNFNAENLSSGVYLYRLQTGNSVLTRRLTLVK